jgi:hypothetical protein
MIENPFPLIHGHRLNCVIKYHTGVCGTLLYFPKWQPLVEKFLHRTKAAESLLESKLWNRI